MKFKIKKFITLFATIAVLVPALYMAFIIVDNVENAQKIARDEFYKITLKTAKMHIEDTLRVCQIMQKSNMVSHENASEAIKELIFKLGAAQISNNVLWAKTYKQSSPEISTNAEIPTIAFGENSITPQKDANENLSTNNAIVEKALTTIKNDTNIDVSIMAKTNDAGSMIRLATTLTTDGKPLLGSMYDDTPETSEIIRTLLARKLYMGMLNIKTNKYLAIYEPITDQYGEVIGAIEYLKNFSDMDFIFDAFENVRIGEDGYLWGLQLTGASSVKLSFFRDSKNSAFANDDLRNLKELEDEIPDIVDTAISTGDSKVILKNIETFDNNSDLLTAFALFKPWNLILGITINKNGLNVSAENLERQISSFGVMVIPVVVLLFIGTMFIATTISNIVVSEISRNTKVIELLKKFDCRSATKEISQPINKILIIEIEQMRNTTHQVIVSISKYLLDINSKVITLAERTKEMSDKSAHIEYNAEKKSTKLSDIQNSLSLINKTSTILNEDSSEAVKGIKSSIAEMKDEALLLTELEENAKMLMSDAQNVALQLSIIKDKADNIANVVNSIKSVGERINMLAINASMEAERNKETSGGFKDVANEITKLSDITAVSAMRISEMASTMCKSVGLGVGEMKKFSLIMNNCKDSIKNVREIVSVAQETTLELSPKFDELSKGIMAHTENITNIENTLVHLSEKSIESRNAIATLSHKTSTINAIASTVIPIKLPKIKDTKTE